MTRKELVVVCLFLGTLALVYSGRQSSAVESKSQVSQFVGKIIQVNWDARNGMLIMTPCHVHDCDVATGMLCLSQFQSDTGMKDRRIWVHPSAFNNVEVITEEAAKAVVERLEKWAAEQNAQLLRNAQPSNKE